MDDAVAWSGSAANNPVETCRFLARPCLRCARVCGMRGGVRRGDAKALRVLEERGLLAVPEPRAAAASQTAGGRGALGRPVEPPNGCRPGRDRSAG